MYTNAISRHSFLCRWKALQMFLGRLWMAIRPKRRIDASLPETHGSKAFQVPPLWSMFFTVRPLGVAHEAPWLRASDWPLISNPGSCSCSWGAPDEIKSKPSTRITFVFWNGRERKEKVEGRAQNNKAREIFLRKIYDRFKANWRRRNHR